ncbi:histidine phosphatase family protein [Streptomyces sp. CA-111067]|uniref:histidine phosphatase family protein n=1 Tax=Streptomyces sp. CA-111067 TaxID=3240046 RepID=UPI003D98DC14
MDFLGFLGGHPAASAPVGTIAFEREDPRMAGAMEVAFRWCGCPESLGADRIGEGLTAVVSVQLDRPEFEGSTRGVLGDAAVRECVGQAVQDHLGEWLTEHPEQAATVIDNHRRHSPVRTLYVVTHPEATHHIEGVVGGWYDSQLTPGGVRAAEAIGQALRGRVPEEAEVRVVSSDLRRTLRTAAEVGGVFGVEPVVDRRLREKSYGEAGGKPQAWLDRRFVPPPAAGERMDHDEGVEGAETRGVYARRIYAAMDEILRDPCEHQIIVTHGGSLTFVIASWIKMPIESAGYASFRSPSGSITTLREDDRLHNRQVVALGDTRHLAPPQDG